MSVMKVLEAYQALEQKGKLGKLGKERFKELINKNKHKKVVQRSFNVS
jgi:hypothetical protein